MIKPIWSPLLMVVSAPSGAGKTTLCERLTSEFETIVYSTSCTTRKPRVGEIDGKNYHFLSDEEFERRREAGAFLECANVHGYMYATPRDGKEGSRVAFVHPRSTSRVLYELVQTRDEPEP